MPEQTYPEPTVGALIFNPDGKMLLVKSYKWGGRYVMPGGHVELGEAIEAALKREITEETGLKIRDLRYIGIQEFIYGEAFWKKKHFLFIDYACKADSSEVTLNGEGQEFAWATVAEALEMDVEPYTKRTIEEFQKKFPEGL